jgi:hypothetical protein
MRDSDAESIVAGLTSSLNDGAHDGARHRHATASCETLTAGFNARLARQKWRPVVNGTHDLATMWRRERTARGAPDVAPRKWD